MGAKKRDSEAYSTLKTGQGYVAKMNFRAFRGQANLAEILFTLRGLIDLLAIDQECHDVPLGPDFIGIPLTRGFLQGLRLLEMRELTIGVV